MIVIGMSDLCPLIGEVAPDIQKEVKGELQQLDTHDDGYAQVQAQGPSEARHQAWWLKMYNFIIPCGSLLRLNRIIIQKYMTLTGYLAFWEMLLTLRDW